MRDDTSSIRPVTCGPGPTSDRGLIESQAVYDSVPIGIAIFDTEFHYVRINEFLARINGMTPEEHVGRTVREVLPTIADQLEPVMQRVLETGAPIEIEVHGKRASTPDTLRFFDEKWFPLRNADGEIFGIGVAVEEITQRKAAEEVVRRGTEEMGALLDSLPAFVWIAHDPSCRVIVGNRAANEMTGVPPGTNVSQTVAPDGAAQYLKQLKLDGTEYEYGELPIQAAISTGQAVRDMYIDFRFPDGRRVLTCGNAVPLFDSRGGVRGAVAAFFDITARVHAEEAIRDLNRTLEERVAARTAEAEALADELRRLATELTRAEHRERQRLAKVLHDHIQQLLVAAQLHATILSSDCGSSDAARTVTKLLDEALAALRVLTAELIPPVLFERGLGAAIGWLADSFSEKYGQVVDVQFDEAAEPENHDLRLLFFDCVREALFNAVKHSGAREARVIAGRGPDRRIRFIISDNGVGFEPDLPRSSTASALGLFSVRQRLRHVGGRLQIDTAPGRGTRITIVGPLPPDDGKATGGVPSARRLRAGIAATGPGHRGSFIRVLLVGDQHIVRQGLAEIVGMDPGIVVVGQASGDVEALALTRELHPDVVVMHVAMPGMDCADATRAILRDRPGVRVVCLLAADGKKLAAMMRSAGAVACIPKEARSQALIAAIHAAAKEQTPVADPTPAARYRKPLRKRST